VEFLEKDFIILGRGTQQPARILKPNNIKNPAQLIEERREILLVRVIPQPYSFPKNTQCPVAHPPKGWHDI